jgi:hypothetical protein
MMVACSGQTATQETGRDGRAVATHLWPTPAQNRPQRERGVLGEAAIPRMHRNLTPAFTDVNIAIVYGCKRWLNYAPTPVLFFYN